MWIVYVGITAAAYAVSNGFYNNSVGSAIITLVVVCAIGGIIHSVYPFTPQGIMMGKIKKDISREYTDHRNRLFSKNNLNVITYCIVFLLFILAFRLPKFIKALANQFYFSNSTFAAIIVLLLGIAVLTGFIYKYKSLPRSEKRELEFLDAETEIAFYDRIDAYQQHKRNNPEYKNITYLGGYHIKTRVNVLGHLKIVDDTLSMYSTYYEKNIFEIPVANIIAVKYEQIDDNSYSSSLYYINMMYLHYISDGEKHMLRFKLGKNIKYALENRIKELNADLKAPKQNPRHQGKAPDEDKKETHQDIQPAEAQKSIEQKYESIENRLERLKYFMDKELITEEEYKNRKQEIISEI